VRIVHAIVGLEPFGAETMVATLVEGQWRRGHEAHVATLSKLGADSPLPARIRSTGAEVSTGRLTKSAPWRALDLGRRLAGFRPDVVHAHLFHANLLTRIAPGRPRVPLVNTIHNTDRRDFGWRILADRLTLRRCAAVTAVSAAAASFHARRTGQPPEAVRVIRNGIVPPRTLAKDDIAALRAEWGVADCSRVIGCVGRLVPEKGFDRLLEILPLLATHVPREETWAIVILGEGREGARLRQIADGAPACFRVLLPGYREGASEAVGAFDVLAVPSRSEGFGLVAAEAQAHGMGIVAQDRDALPEVLDGYGNAVLTDFHGSDPLPAVEALGQMASAPPPHRPRAPYTADEMVEEYLSLYEEILGRA